jgi:hypothetical protein
MRNLRISPVDRKRIGHPSSIGNTDSFQQMRCFHRSGASSPIATERVSWPSHVVPASRKGPDQSIAGLPSGQDSLLSFKEIWPGNAFLGVLSVPNTTRPRTWSASRQEPGTRGFPAPVGPEDGPRSPRRIPR